MSWYVNFYLGLMDQNNKIIPLGVYDYKGELKCIHSTSRSFTTELHELFYPIQKKMITDELRKEFPYDADGELSQYFGYLPLSELPKGDWIKSGFYLLEDITNYLNYKNGKTDDYDGFYDMLTPTEYAFKLENELKFGKEIKQDEFGNEGGHSCSEYTYFSYPDYECMEYEAHLLRIVAEILMDSYEVPNGSQIVVIKTEG